jgi:hypothetical protein
MFFPINNWHFLFYYHHVSSPSNHHHLNTLKPESNRIKTIKLLQTCSHPPPSFPTSSPLRVNSLFRGIIFCFNVIIPKLVEVGRANLIKANPSLLQSCHFPSNCRRDRPASSTDWCGVRQASSIRGVGVNFRVTTKDASIIKWINTMNTSPLKSHDNLFRSVLPKSGGMSTQHI